MTHKFRQPLIKGCLLVFFSAPALAGDWNVHFLDVGYGDAIIIERPDGHVTLIDAGSRPAAENIKEFLKSKGIAGIDAVVLTHPHENHCGGLAGLTPLVRAPEIFFNGDTGGDEICAGILETLRRAGRTIKTVKAGDVIYEGRDHLLKVLHPYVLGPGTNDNSLVLWLKAEGKGFLFTADIGMLGQAALVREFPFVSQAHAVQVPHHGGAVIPSWKANFPRAVFIMSTGKNPYGLPSKETLNALTGKLYRTDQGAITLTSKGKEISIVQHP